MVAAGAARRWLARNAAGVKLIRNQTETPALVCIRLVCCLPALEDVTLYLAGPLPPDILRCLLEALAWCPRLRALDLSMYDFGIDEADEDENWPFPDASVFAELRGLTKLALHFSLLDAYTLADAVGALVPLTGLAELCMVSRSLPSCPPPWGS